MDWFSKILDSILGVSFVYQETGQVTLFVSNPKLSLRLNKEIGTVLGPSRKRLTPGLIYQGNYNLTPFKSAFCSGLECDVLGILDFDTIAT